MKPEDTINQLVESMIESGYSSLCFWAPAYNVGGAQHIYCKIARYLAENTPLKVYYMDYADGYAATTLINDSTIIPLAYRDEDMNFPVDEPCVIIVNSTRVIQLKKMNPKNKILFWHYETARCAWHVVLLRNETRRFLELTKKENAMMFHDWSAFNILNRQFDIGFDNPKYLPMLVAEKENLCTNFELINENEINIVWVGRISKDKVYSVFSIIENLAKYKTDKKKVFHIVGKGLMMDALKKFAAKYKKQINFDFTGTIPNDQLTDFLVSHADVVFGMGLSIAEGGASKLPSVVVQLDTKPFHDEDYFWLFDTMGYCVGICPEQKEDFDIKYTKFSDIMDQIYIDGRKKELSEKSYQYYKENYSDLYNIITLCLSHINDSSLTADKLEECIRYMPYTTIKLVRKNS